MIAYNAGNGPVVDKIPYLTYLGQDEYQGGYQAGQRLAALGGKKGVCINQQVGHAGLDKRCKGFVDALKEKNLTAEVLGITDDPARSQTTISDYYTSHPDVDIFLTLGPNGANPFYAFLQTANLKKGAFWHGTFDLGPEIIAKIKDGTTQFGIDQQPFLQGYGTVQALVLKVAAGPLPGHAGHGDRSWLSWMPRTSHSSSSWPASTASRPRLHAAATPWRGCRDRHGS